MLIAARYKKRKILKHDPQNRGWAGDFISTENGGGKGTVKWRRRDSMMAQ